MKKIRGIWLPDSDMHFEEALSKSRKVDGGATYQLNKYESALHHVKRRELALDIGAHVGLWARVMARDFAAVHAYEPVPEHIACFQENCGRLKNVVLHPVAVSNEAGHLFMDTPKENTGHTQVSLRPDTTRPPATAIALDDCEYPSQIDFVKIDVEGFEYNVVRGGEETLRMHKPVIILEQKKNGNAEHFGIKQLAAVELLESWGMRPVQVLAGDYIMAW